MNGVKSKNILLYVNIADAGAPFDWLMVGCSAAVGYSSSRDAVAISTKCSGDFVENLPGDFTWSFDNSAYVDKDATADFATWNQLFDISKEDGKRKWKLESIDPDYTFLFIGDGFISDLGVTSDQGDYLQTSITITGSGEPLDVETT